MKFCRPQEKVKTIAEINAVLSRTSRESMRVCAMEYRRALARCEQSNAKRWLAFASFHRAAAQECTTGKRIDPELIRAVDTFIRQLAVDPYDKIEESNCAGLYF